MAGPDLGTGNKVVDKVDKVPGLLELILWGRM